MDVFSDSTNNTSSAFTEHVLKNLIDKAKSGDDTAFAGIYNAYFEKMYRFVYFRVSHRETAEDLTEEVFIKIFENLGSLANTDVFEGWMYQIARNKVIDYYRSKKQLVPLEDVENVLEYDHSIVDEVSADGDQRLMLKAIKELPVDYQQIVKLKFFEDLSTSEIATMLGKNEGTIRVLQHRAVTKLKTIIDSLTPPLV